MIYQFEDFALDTDRRELRRGAAPIALEPQVFDLLQFLIENRTRIVSRAQIFEAVWQNRAVSDSVLGTRLNAARQAIADDGAQQRLIRTQRRTGIRFVGAVVERVGDEDVAATDRGKGHSPNFVIPDTPLVLLRPFSYFDASGPCRLLAAVLAEELGVALHAIQWLRVVSAPLLSRGDARLRAAAGAARYGIDGSVRAEGDQRVVVARLCDLHTGACLWTDRYRYDAAAAPTQPAAIAQAIGRAVGDHLFAYESVRARAINRRSRSAWEAIVAALSLINSRKKEQVEKAQRILQLLVDSETGQSAAFSLLSFCTTLGTHLGWTSRKQNQSIARRYAERALAFDELDPWAHLALGYARLQLDNRPDDAIALFDEALRLDPRASMAHYLQALSYVYIGDPGKAFRHADHAERCSSLDLLARGNVGAHDNVRATASFVANRFRDGIVFARKAIAVSPLQVPAYRQLTLNAAFAGDVALASAAFKRVTASSPDVRMWLTESEPIWSRKNDFRKYVEAFRIAGHKA